MSTRIAYSNTGTGQNIATFVNEVQVVLSLGRRLMAKLNSASYGADWTGVETEVGGMTPGNGQNLWTILANAMAAIDVPAVAELARLDKQ